MCDAPLDCVELDHIGDLSQQTYTAEQTFQALCPACHRSKTVHNRPDNPIMSYFSQATYEGFVKQPKPAQCVFC